MWLRHALKLIIPILLLSACSPSDRQAVDKLNSLSYAYHFRQVDSAAHYAQQAFNLANREGSVDGKAEALNH